MRILLIGAGGHAEVIADALLQQPDVELAGYLDDNASSKRRNLLGAPVYGRETGLAQIPHDAVIVAIGDNTVRRRIYDDLRRQGVRFAVARHPSAILASGVTLGAGSMICAGVIINTGASVGENAIINTGAIVEHHVVIGDHAHVAPGVRLGGEAVVGDGTLVGIGATVLPRIRVGSRSIVGGGAVVTRPVPDGVTVVGTPARALKRLPSDA